MGLFNYVLVYVGDLHLVCHALNFSILDAGILIMAISKFDDVLLEHGGLPHVLPVAVDLKFVLLEK